MKLLIMACSATKRTEVGPMPAMERYDGPMWRTLRALLARHPEAASAYASGALDIWAISARFGFVPASMEMPDYDRKMTAPIMAKMLRDPSYDLQRICLMVQDAEAVMFVGGELYRNAMWRASGGNLGQIMKIDETDGPGIGRHREQLGEWIRAQFPKSEALAA